MGKEERLLFNQINKLLREMDYDDLPDSGADEEFDDWEYNFESREDLICHSCGGNYTDYAWCVGCQNEGIWGEVLYCPDCGTCPNCGDPIEPSWWRNP